MRHPATVKATGTLKCIKMGQNQFIREVKPVLDILKERANQYKSFTDLFV